MVNNEEILNWSWLPWQHWTQQSLIFCYCLDWETPSGPIWHVVLLHGSMFTAPFLLSNHASPSLSFSLRLCRVQHISDSSQTWTSHKPTARSETKPFRICFPLSKSCNFGEVTFRQGREMLAGGSGWFDIRMLGSDVVVNKTQVQYNLQSPTNII